MTSVVQAPLMAATTFEPRARSASYHDLPILDTSMSFASKAKPQTSYVHTQYDPRPSLGTSASSSSVPSPTSTQFSHSDSLHSTPASSLTSEQADVCDGHRDEDDDLTYPAYDQQSIYQKQPPTISRRSSIESQASTLNSSPSDGQTELPQNVNDDHAIEHEPTRHVDYLSHQWKEEDIWTSWRYIVSRRSAISNRVRLENAAWRTWIKVKYDLRTITPETLNWLKDCDVTWLYGPLQTGTKCSMMNDRCVPPSDMSRSSSFVCKKPILKKKSASAAILERSRSQQSLLQRASEIIRQQQASPAVGRPPLLSGGAEFQLPSYTNSSVANTPVGHETPSTASRRYSFAWPEAQTPADQKHVLFDETVRQVQAIDSEDDGDHDTDTPDTEVCDSSDDDDDDDDDEAELTMAPVGSKASIRHTPRNSFCDQNKTIMALPSTKLKKGRTDEPGSTSHDGIGTPWSHPRLSPSPSQETLRPTRPNHSFMCDDDPELGDDLWCGSSDTAPYSPYEDDEQPGPLMRRTESGMFMPYEENSDEAVLNKSLYGQAMYAVNTFKDIAHVVWNVGWSRK